MQAQLDTDLVRERVKAYQGILALWVNVGAGLTLATGLRRGGHTLAANEVERVTAVARDLALLASAKMSEQAALIASVLDIDTDDPNFSAKMLDALNQLSPEKLERVREGVRRQTS